MRARLHAGLAAFDIAVLTARADDAAYDFVSRCFGPKFGIDEDPVTGSAHCALGPYWAERLGQDRADGLPGVGAGRRRARAVDGDRTVLAGRAVTVSRGELASRSSARLRRGFGERLDSVGCTRSESTMSLTVSPLVTATAITLMSSAALRPTIEPPSTTPVAGSERIFTNPRGSPLMCALAFDENGTFVTRIFLPNENASASASPTSAISGSVKIAWRRLVVVEVTVGTVVQAHEVLGDLATLHGADRRERQLPGHVAGGVDVLDVRAAVVVDRDVAAAVDLDPRLVEPEVLAVRDRPDRQHRVRPFHDPAVLACDSHRVADALDAARRVHP